MVIVCCMRGVRCVCAVGEKKRIVCGGDISHNWSEMGETVTYYVANFINWNSFDSRNAFQPCGIH